ncbi:peptidoglycan recognition family protein [Nocardiopsis sp. L17-MgMaSL7]|uniref:peptidoglycan recognition protein family protein n=1 Tax=Nocardiopsis sp. L17-MgMaSL7 TaxID=1938893 RepID=UPI000D7161BA|nr:peptidoglycan recognition family protein [Nocardiopsis sp. L17-MgMaSL7]PWV47881.1 N-acetylmuramoyl-L-alanine amidase [Nocardiopsis sp. L17-MgMaSL7]
MAVERLPETDHPLAVDRRTMLRGAALTAGGVLLGGALGVSVTGQATAAATPKVYTRSDWGARAPKGTIEVLAKGPTHIVVHHTATSNVSDTSTTHAAALSRSIQRYHMDNNGWSDTGQQLTISRGGHIMEGRDKSLQAIRDGKHVLGAHTANHNSHTIGIENEGTYTSSTPPGALMSSLVDTCAWLCLVYRLDPQKAIVGHRDYNATNCPGDKLYAMLPKLRDDVGSSLRKQLSHMSEHAGRELTLEELPSYPTVPSSERVATFYHGPTVGDLDSGF